MVSLRSLTRPSNSEMRSNFRFRHFVAARRLRARFRSNLIFSWVSMLIGLKQLGGGDPAPEEPEDPASGSHLSFIRRSWAYTVWGISNPEEVVDDEDADAEAS